jgi:O-acetyl-ADP-ribose deacetylase (regulator of RNase III)
MERVQGDLLELAERGQFDIVVQGCNCFHKMRSGIAKQIAAKYPSVEAADFATLKGDRGKLGNFSFAYVDGDNGHRFCAINAYTQYRWSGYEDVFEYDAFETFLNRLCPFIAKGCESMGRRVNVGFPMIGCGYARGDKTRIIPMIERFSDDVAKWGKVTLVSYGSEKP